MFYLQSTTTVLARHVTNWQAARSRVVSVLPTPVGPAKNNAPRQPVCGAVSTLPHDLLDEAFENIVLTTDALGEGLAQVSQTLEVRLR